MIDKSRDGVYKCWLSYNRDNINCNLEALGDICYVEEQTVIINAVKELKLALDPIVNKKINMGSLDEGKNSIFISTAKVADKTLNTDIDSKLENEGYAIEKINLGHKEVLLIAGKDSSGVLYGVYHFIRGIYTGKFLDEIITVNNPKNELRMINHWDNGSGDIERGYSGQSIFYKDNIITEDLTRIRDYSRLMSSVGINSIVINNVNVHKHETYFITDKYLPKISRIADIFREYGIKLYLSINFASPIELGGLSTADPLEECVKQWWKDTAEKIYDYIPDFGGFLVKADSEFRPGPFTYGRNHAEGANMLAEALEPHGGLVIWRCFVYNCLLDWRDRSKDRAKAAYDNFKPLDGQFKDNVVLQVKNGPMDFQIREPISPLLGGMEHTNETIEFQIAQEYTGQQKHVCYLVPMWKESLDFDTYAKGEESTVKKVVNGSLFGNSHGGFAAVTNLGDSKCWTGHPLAQANLYGFGRLAWNPELTSEEIAEEWTKLTFGLSKEVNDIVNSILLSSREVYENYTVPLGIGWMVYPHHHYGPNVDGYEYTPWGTYHYADFRGIGVDRTCETGTGYTGQYKEQVKNMYESLETCPDEMLLFFHHLTYDYKLKSGKTLIQHVYDTHFEGVEAVEKYIEKWTTLEGKVEAEAYNLVRERLDIQLKDSKEWRDVINTYFYRRTGIDDIHGRKIYK